MQFDQLKRREFVSLLGGAATWPLAARAQQTPSRMVRVGMVSPNPRNSPFTSALDQRMRALGYIEGQNYAFEFIDLHGEVERWGEATKELIRRKVDIVIASGAEIALKSALAVSNTVPIVMVAINYDPLALGYVASLAHPSGNVTGV